MADAGGLFAGLDAGITTSSSSSHQAAAAAPASQPAEPQLALRSSGARKWGPAQFSAPAADAAPVMAASSSAPGMYPAQLHCLLSRPAWFDVTATACSSDLYWHERLSRALTLCCTVMQAWPARLPVHRAQRRSLMRCPADEPGWLRPCLAAAQQPSHAHAAGHLRSRRAPCSVLMRDLSHPEAPVLLLRCISAACWPHRRTICSILSSS